MVKKRIIFPTVILCFVVFLFAISNTHPVQGVAPDDQGLSSKSDEITSKKEKPACLDILREVIAAGGFEGEETNIQDESDLDKDFYWCSIEVSQVMQDRTSEHYYSYDEIRIGIFSYESNPEIMSGGNEMTRIGSTFYGFPALLEYNEPLAENPYLFHWYVPDHELVFWFDAYNYDTFDPDDGPDYHVYSTPDPIAVAEIFYSVVYNRMPELRLPRPEENLANDDLPIIIATEAVTEQPEIVVEPYGGETETPAEEQPEVVVVPFGSDGDGSQADSSSETGTFTETWDSEQAKAIRSPYLPIVGGLIGGGAAWLFAQGAAKASGYASSMAAAVPAPVVAPEIPQTPPELVTEPPELVSEPPPMEVKKVNVVTPGEAGYTIMKEAVNATGNVAGVYDKYLAGKDSAETLNAVREAIKDWHNAPSAQTKSNYLEKLKNLNALKENKLADKLGYVGKAVDVLEAGADALKICEERGYTGWEAAATGYAKVAEKAIVWYITKNPVAGLADAAVGGVTQMVRGKKGRIDLSAVVDKAHDTIDSLSKSAADKYYYNTIETAALKQKNENVQNLVERIRKQVEEGKITKNEGAYRLEKVLEKVNRETPKI